MELRWNPQAGLLAALTALCLVLTACADDSSDRQFAGDEQSTAGPTATSPAIPTIEPAASQAPAATPLTEDELLAIRSNDEFAVIIVDGDVFLMPSSLEDPIRVDIDDKWTVWHAAESPGGDQVAVLVSLATSVKMWSILVVDGSGAIIGEHNIIGDEATAGGTSDVVTGGTGGMDWSPDATRVAVALPTGGIYSVNLGDDGVQEMSPPRRVPRVGDLAWSHNGRAIAYAARPDGKSGYGVYVAPASALPLDPITVIKPDSTGNRSARDITWSAGDARLLVILERRETGNSGGDVMTVSANGGQPAVIWSAGMFSGNDGAMDIALSPDGAVLAILSTGEDESFVDYMQSDGPAETRIGIPLDIDSGAVTWTGNGLLVAGSGRSAKGDSTEPEGAIIDGQGDVTIQETTASTPIASPVPVGSPVPASPVASPVAASPVASPLGSPPASTPRSD